MFTIKTAAQIQLGTSVASARRTMSCWNRRKARSSKSDWRPRRAIAGHVRPGQTRQVTLYRTISAATMTSSGFLALWRTEIIIVLSQVCGADVVDDAAGAFRIGQRL